MKLYKKAKRGDDKELGAPLDWHLYNFSVLDNEIKSDNLRIGTKVVNEEGDEVIDQNADQYVFKFTSLEELETVIEHLEYHRSQWREFVDTSI
jgi:hypothetical protein